MNSSSSRRVRGSSDAYSAEVLGIEPSWLVGISSLAVAVALVGGGRVKTMLASC